MNLKSSTLKLLIFFVCALSASACVSPEKAQEPGGAVQMMPNGSGTQDKFLQVIEQFSRGETEYLGLYNQFTYKATIVNSPIQETLLLHQAEYYKWDPTQLETERDKAAKAMLESTQVFISFYTPEHRDDNLADSKSIWRVYLDVGGKRYEGKAKKSKKLLTELHVLYPYHTRWNTPYYIEFAVPTATAEATSSKLVVTGPLGTKEVEFPPAK